jgi:hypothetical protein
MKEAMLFNMTNYLFSQRPGKTEKEYPPFVNNAP